MEDNLRINIINVKISKNYFGVPKFIQLDRQATIRQLKEKLSLYDNRNSETITDLNTFVFNENGELIEDESIEFYNFFQVNKLTVWRGINLKVQLKICNPLAGDPSARYLFLLEISITESIVNLKKKISERFSIGKQMKLALFTEISYLQDGRCLLDYPIPCENCEVFYVDLIKKENIGPLKKIKDAKYSKMFLGSFGNFSDQVLVNRYRIKQNEQISKILKYEIVTRIILSNSPENRFVFLISLYEESKYFYIVTDFMERGSLKDIYLKNPINDQEIIHYSIQISEALDFMHTTKFIHRNLSCSSVLIDLDNNIKLSNFHLSKYLIECTTTQLLEGVPGSRIDNHKCWLAPEVLHNEPYGIKSDIWSFGVTVMEMLTRNRPYPDDSILLASYKIHQSRAIEYNRDISPPLSTFIDRCLHSSQEERPTAKQCKQLLEVFS